MNKPTLLCVEDDTEALEDIVYLLKRHFSKVYTATDGEEALSNYTQYKPDLILLDINIPKLDGLKVASQIREDDENIPIVFLTAHSEKEKLLKAINLKVESYIIKPFKIVELKEVITKSIDQMPKHDMQTISLGDGFSWNTDSYELFCAEEKISLTKNEISLIKILLENRSRFLSAMELSLELGTSENDISGNSVVQLISRFKRKITQQTNCENFFIENIYGSGYRIK